MPRIALAVLFLALCAPARALQTETVGASALGPAFLGSPSASVLAASGGALVRLSSGTVPSSFDASLAGLGASRGQDLGNGWHFVALAPGQSVASGLVALRSLPGVLSADPNAVHEVVRAPNDPLLNSQYALAAVSASAAWEYEVGTSCRTTIAIIDTGVSTTHSDLSAKFTDTGASNASFDPSTGAQGAHGGPACNHATRVAGVAAASSDNSNKIAGMSWGAQLLSLKVFRDVDCNAAGDCPGTCLTADTGIIAAINYAVGLRNTAAVGRVVVNMSLGGAGACSAAVNTAMGNAVTAGVPIFVSAGNDGGAVNNPGNCANAIPVGATDSLNNVASFSSRGTELAINGLVAPGVSVLTTDINDGTASATGTSFSAPMAAGVGALMISAKPALGADAAGVASLKAALRGGADQIGVSALGTAPSGSTAGAGRLDAFRALRLAINGTLVGFDGESKPIAFPNPFKPSENGQVSFAVPPSLQGQNQTIKIYTLDGQLVKSLNTLSWNGKNTEGTNVASGTYVFVVSSSAGTGRGRFSVLR